MKYIMFVDKLNRKIPVVFPSNLVHQIVAESFAEALAKHNIVAQPVSAGDLDVDYCKSTGKSTTMHLTSDPEDGGIIERYQYFHGY